MKIIKLKGNKNRAIIPKQKAQSRVYIRFRLPKRTKELLPGKITKDGYGLREKSLWIQGALQTFLDDPYWKAMAVEKSYIPNDANDGVYLPYELHERIEKAAEELVEYAEKEGRNMQRSMSHIIRSAVIAAFIDT